MTNRSRNKFFAELRAATSEYYLAEPNNPYRQSGRSSGAERWELTRRCIADAVDADGEFLDVGCANGLLQESLMAWTSERGIAIVPHGIDFVPELIILARVRLPAWADNFEAANAFYWIPSRRYRYVRTELEYVPLHDRLAFTQRLINLAVEDGGRLIVCRYGPLDADEPRTAESALADLGFAAAGRSACTSCSLAWIEK